MYILGLSCGRDASASVLHEGRIAAHIIRERLTRRKHDAGLCRATIDEALKSAGITLDDIGCCALALSAGKAPLSLSPDALTFAEGPLFTPLKAAYSPLELHTETTVTLAGRSLPAYAVRAHAAHGASAYYGAGLARAAVITHDSGAAWDSGLMFLGQDGALQALGPHGLQWATFYNNVAKLCGLGLEGAGKLMGLAAYGAPHLVVDAAPEAAPALMLGRARALGYDLSPLGDAAALPCRIAADLAASAQAMFSQGLLELAQTLRETLQKDGAALDGLCLGGGAALNCPTNTRLAEEAGYKQVFIEPFCDNSGLSIGAARWVWHVVQGHGLLPVQSARSCYAMIGADRRDEVEIPPTLHAETPQDSAAAAAHDLAEGKIIGWFEGRSEAGPRALGHRSLLADPRRAENHLRANAIKSRETWRPLAPMCLLEDFDAWFEGPCPSPFMLMTHRVKLAKQKEIPAVVHADGSARVQTVGPEDGQIYHVLKAFKARTGVPVLLNTSFNGPQEPIVERPREAIQFFLAQKLLDVLYLEGTRLTRHREESA